MRVHHKISHRRRKSCVKLCTLCKQYLNFWKINLQEKFSSNRLWERTCQHAMYFIGWKFFYLAPFHKWRPLLSPLAITSRLPFLVISAWLSLTIATESRLFKVSSCFPLFQVQARLFYSKPMCHEPVFQKERFLISWLINCHSSSVSIETRSPPWCLQTFLFFCQLLPHFEKYVPGIIEACVLAFYDKINK